MYSSAATLSTVAREPHLGQYAEAITGAISIASQLIGKGKKRKKKPPPPPPPPPPRPAGGGWMWPVTIGAVGVAAVAGGMLFAGGRRRRPARRG